METLPPPDATPSPDRRSLRILYAEDMVELQKFVTLVLTRAGHRVEMANDGQIAIDKLKSEAGVFDLLLTDHQMPNLNGLELVRYARQILFPGKIAVFASELNPATHQAYRLLNVELIMTKPISPTNLRAKLEEMFSGDGTGEFSESKSDA